MNRFFATPTVLPRKLAPFVDSCNALWLTQMDLNQELVLCFLRFAVERRDEVMERLGPEMTGPVPLTPEDRARFAVADPVRDGVICVKPRTGYLYDFGKVAEESSPAANDSTICHKYFGNAFTSKESGDVAQCGGCFFLSLT